ncbi:hypothetical protein AB0J47_41985 [Nocardia sp. NPDC049737]|uniref:hypothetical protein n=1 Tax=Nocardia sp. NPDC049737 TaxID=3154358 RepID=UPI00342B73BA
MPTKLSAQVRVFATGNGRKTEPVDAHSVALAALRAPNLRQVRADPDLVAPGLLVDRRDELGRARTDAINRIHRLLLELLPGGAKKYLSSRQARELIASVRPRDRAAQLRCRLTLELIEELEGIDRKIKTLDKELRQLVLDHGSTHACPKNTTHTCDARASTTRDARRAANGRSSRSAVATPRSNLSA